MRWLPWLLAAAFATAYAALACARYRAFITPSWDLAIFTEVIDHYAHLQAPIAEVKGVGFNFLGDHFSPALAVLAPVYRLAPSPLTLLVAQSVLLGLSVVPVSRTGLRRLAVPVAVLVTLAYGLSFGLLSAVLVDFHEVALAVPLLAWSLEAFSDRRWRACLWRAIPLVLVKEDLGATVAVIAGLVALRGGRTVRARALVVAALALAASALEVLVLIPALADSGSYAYFGNFAGAPPSGGGGVRLHTAWRLLAVTGGGAVLSPIALAALPTLAWRFMSSNPAYWGTDWHYDAIVMPILFVALIDGLHRLRGHRVAWAGLVALLVAGFASSAWHTPLRQLGERSLWAGNPHRAALRAAQAQVPAGVTVASDLGVISHLVGRDTVYWISTPGVRPEYVVVDAGTGWAPPPPRELPGWYAAAHPGASYRLVWTRDGVSLLRRVTRGTEGVVE
jgi:uncharacterized membrane protein